MLANSLPRRSDISKQRLADGLSAIPSGRSPNTRSLMESLVKEINLRVKGTEKFWDDGTSGEAIL